jgi:hypothetical protein
MARSAGSGVRMNATVGSEAEPPRVSGPVRGPRRTRSRRPLAVSLAVGLAVLACAAVLLSPSIVPGSLLSLAPGPRGPSGPPHATNASNPPVGLSLNAGAACNSVSTPTPSSVLVPVPGPVQSLPTGGTVAATLEYGAVNVSAPALGARVFAPSQFASFPLATGGSVQIYFPPHAFPVTGPGWLNGSVTNRSVVSGTGWSFASGASALLSSQKIAVMANASYGALEIEVRWHWTVTDPNGSVQAGAWSVPTTASHWPTATPSVFDPAPVVSVLSTNGPNQIIGTNFSASLAGFVAARYFFLELEFPSTGKVVQAHGQTSAPNATATTVTIPMLNYNRYLAPGHYLVHVHDGCGAMLLSLPQNASYAASATITVSVSPASCGKVTVNGSSYANGATFSIAPSSSAYSFGLSGCSGHAFRSWHFTGGLSIASGRLLVSASGGVAIAYS